MKFVLIVYIILYIYVFSVSGYGAFSVVHSSAKHSWSARRSQKIIFFEIGRIRASYKKAFSLFFFYENEWDGAKGNA